MKLQFLGTGAAEGVPAVFCRCETCERARKHGGKDLRSRSQYLVDGKVGIDFPADAYLKAERFGVDLTKMEHLLVTHSHFDHFYAHEFVLRGYKYTQTQLPPLHIYGNEEVASVFAECTRRELRNEVRENIFVHTVEPFKPFSLGENNGYTATALLAQHSKTERAYVYLLEKGDTSYLHLTDTGRLPEETLGYLENYFSDKPHKLAFITFDCTFLFYTAGNISRHMGLEDNRVMLDEFLRRNVADGHTQCAISHFSHNSAPLRKNMKKAQKEYGFLSAYDGLCVEF